MPSEDLGPQDLAASGVTIPSDSENYSANNGQSPSPPPSSNSPLILYSPPTVWGLLRGAAINLLLPFINGLMLGFGELLAHEAAFRFGWSGTKFSHRIAVSSWSPYGTINPRQLPRTQCPRTFHHPTRSNYIDSIHFISKRFASTKLDVPQSLDSSYTANAAPLSDSVGDFTSSSLDGITADISPQVVGESLGFLKQLGLDFGWGPTAIMQTVLESVYLTTGVPWWGSIILTALLLRVVSFPLVVRAADTSARMATITPLMAPIKKKMEDAKVTRDVEALQRATAEIRQLYKMGDIKILTMALPMILQAPLGFGSFRLLRNMALLPVPGLDEGGLLWISDLTLSDPYFILPIAMGLGLHWTFKKGGEMASAQVMKPAMQMFLVYIIPLISAGCMLPLPAAVQLSFATASSIALLQAHYLRQPWFREYLSIQPLPSTAPPSSAPVYQGTITIQAPSTAAPEPPPAPKGIIGGAISDIKGAASQVVKQAQALHKPDEKKRGNQRLTQAELKRAHAYEAQRQREIAQEKLDAESALQERKSRSAR